MNKNKFIEDAREILKSLMFNEEIKFSDYTDENGMKIKCDSSEVGIGSGVVGVDEAGNDIPLDNGEYNLNNGQTIVVVDGKVSEIKDFLEPKDGEVTPVEDARVEAAAAPVVEEPKVEGTVVEDKVVDDTEKKVDSELMDRLTKVEATLATVLDALDKLTKGTQAMEEQVQEFSKMPAVEIVQTIKNDRELTLEEKRTERMRLISQSVR